MCCLLPVLYSWVEFADWFRVEHVGCCISDPINYKINSDSPSLLMIQVTVVKKCYVLLRMFHVRRSQRICLESLKLSVVFLKTVLKP